MCGGSPSSSTRGVPGNDEMENYRMALAYISKQSTDPQSRDLAETALNAFPDSGEPMTMDDLIKKMDGALTRSDENAGYEAFCILRKNWPSMRTVLGQPQISQAAHENEKEIVRLATIEECAIVAEQYPSSGKQTEYPVEYWIRRLSNSRPLRQGEDK